MPDHLWVHAFLCGYGRDHPAPRHLQALGLSAEALVGGLGNPSPPEGWEATTSGLSTLALFRSFALCRWQRQVLLGFLAWRRRNVRVTKGCSPGQMASPLLSTKEGEGVPLLHGQQKAGSPTRHSGLSSAQARTDKQRCEPAMMPSGRAHRPLGLSSWKAWLLSSGTEVRLTRGRCKTDSGIF